MLAAARLLERRRPRPGHDRGRPGVGRGRRPRGGGDHPGRLGGLGRRARDTGSGDPRRERRQPGFGSGAVERRPGVGLRPGGGQPALPQPAGTGHGPTAGAGPPAAVPAGGSGRALRRRRRPVPGRERHLAGPWWPPGADRARVPSGRPRRRPGPSRGPGGRVPGGVLVAGDAGVRRGGGRVRADAGPRRTSGSGAPLVRAGLRAGGRARRPRRPPIRRARGAGLLDRSGPASSRVVARMDRAERLGSMAGPPPASEISSTGSLPTSASTRRVAPSPTPSPDGGRAWSPSG